MMIFFGLEAGRGRAKTDAADHTPKSFCVVLLCGNKRKNDTPEFPSNLIMDG